MPISDCEVRDPRMKRTRQLLQGALRTLMQTRSFDEISVQDIAEAATVNRATFYDHYTDKFVLLEAMVAGGFHAMLHERKVAFDGTCSHAVGAIIICACDYISQAHAGTDCEARNAFHPLMDAAITASIQRVLMKGMPLDSHSPLSPELVATSVSWAICGAVKEWCATPKRATAEQITPLLLNLILPMLEAGGALKH